VLIWIDASDDLGKQILRNSWGPSSGKLQHNDYTLWPIVRYRPNMGLNAHVLHEDEVSSSSAALPSASQFHLSFGRSLQRNAMAADPFYALYEVFGICSASQKQFLNLVEHKLTQYTKHNDGDFDALPNLRYIKQILSRQMKQIQEVRHTIGNTKQSKWPRVTSDVTMRAEQAVDQDYLHLFDYAKTLDGRCQEAIEILMNSVAILDSKKAMLQSERVAKLTFLAFIFVPLSFTTSFFGMNFRELEKQSIWEWFTLTAPIMGFTLIVFFVDILGRWNALVNSIKKRIR